jgi:hypothetical protein
MLTFALAPLALGAALAGPAAADDTQVRHRMWTVGTQAGTRPSSEVCRWKTELFVGGRIDSVRVVEGSKAGNCRFVKAAVEAERDRKVAALQLRTDALASN